MSVHRDVSYRRCFPLSLIRLTSFASWVDILYAPNFIAKTTQLWETHSEFEDLTRIDLRWFALFHTVLAFGVLLDKQADLGPAERQAISDKCFVRARRALSEAPSFYGESLDTVAAYTLVGCSVAVGEGPPLFGISVSRRSTPTIHHHPHHHQLTPDVSCLSISSR